jgi:hypothetical protein
MSDSTPRLHWYLPTAGESRDVLRGGTNVHRVEAGWRPLVVFGAAAVFNLVVGLALSSVLFAGVEV